MTEMAHSTQEWEQACQESQDRSWERRYGMSSPHPFPSRGQRAAAFLFAILAITVAWLFLFFTYAVWPAR